MKTLLKFRSYRPKINRFDAPDGYRAVATNGKYYCIDCVFSDMGSCDEIYKANCLSSMRKDKCDVIFIKSKTSECRVDYYKRVALRNAFLAGVAITFNNDNAELGKGLPDDVIEGYFGIFADKYVSDIVK